MNRKIKGHENLGLSDKERAKLIKKAEKQFGNFLTALNYDWKNDPNMSETPHRVTKAYVEELFAGNFKPKPKITSFTDDSEPNLMIDGIVLQQNIQIISNCSHHFLPFTGVCHIAYMPEESGTVIGLSKLNRIADFCARRPQVQERLTKQILNMISDEIPGNKGVAVFVTAKHSCCSNRGIGHDSTMKTFEVSGVFRDDKSILDQFMFMLNQK